MLVVFEHGDINRPIVIGTLWSKKQEPVEVNDSGKNNTKLIRSRSGHRVIFEDTEGAEKVTVVDKTKKNKIVLDSANKIVAIESDGDIVLKSAANVIIHSNALKIGTSGNLIGKGQQVLIHATSTFGIKASDRIVVDGSSVTINVNNSPAARVSGSGAGFLGGAGTEVVRDQVAEQFRSSDNAGSSGGDPVPGNVGASPVQASPNLTFIEVELVDTDEKPVPFASYRVTASDGTVFSGWLDIDGHARIDGVAVGNCKVTFPDFHGDDWSIV